MSMRKNTCEGPAAYPEQLVRRHALRRLAEIFQIPETSLSPDDRFGEELKAAPPSDLRLNAFDLLDDDIKWLADKRLRQAMASGNLVIHTVGDYCDHMVRCSHLNPAGVADILGLGGSGDAASLAE